MTKFLDAKFRVQINEYFDDEWLNVDQHYDIVAALVGNSDSFIYDVPKGTLVFIFKDPDFGSAMLRRLEKYFYSFPCIANADLNGEIYVQIFLKDYFSHLAGIRPLKSSNSYLYAKKCKS